MTDDMLEKSRTDWNRVLVLTRDALRHLDHWLQIDVRLAQDSLNSIEAIAIEQLNALDPKQIAYAGELTRTKAKAGHKAAKENP